MGYPAPSVARQTRQICLAPPESSAGPLAAPCGPVGGFGMAVSGDHGLEAENREGR